jgi:pyruvate,water dikinase
MPRKEVVEFPNPYEVAIPGTEGWERMYPPSLILQKERREEFEKRNWNAQPMHWPKALKPFDCCATVFPVPKGLTPYQHRIFVVPPSRGFSRFIINGWEHGFEVPPYTDPKVIGQRVPLFLQRMIYCWFNWNKIYPKWKRDMMAMFKEQYSLYEQISDLPEIEDLEFFKEVRGITSARRLVEVYDRVVHLYLRMQEGYQYQFIGMAYAAEMNFSNFCGKHFPGMDEKDIAKMLTGADLEAFRPDEEVKKLARLAVNLGLAPDVKNATDFARMRSELEKTGAGRKWVKEFEKNSFPWFYMMVTQGIFAYSDEECWIENPNIILGFLKTYIEKIEKGEKIERDVKALLAKKKQIFDKYLNMLKTDVEKNEMKQNYDLATTFYEFVEDQVIYIKHINYALFRRNVKKFAEILAKHGVIKEPEDVFFLKFEEIKSALEELTCAWGAGEPPSQYWI